MKKIILCSSLLFLILFQNELYAQPRITAGTNSDGIQIGCSGSCLESFNIEVNLANLDLLAPSGSGQQEFFPTGYPPMFLEINMLGTIMMRPIQAFTYTETIENIRIFTATIPVTINTCDYCSDNVSGIHHIRVGLRLTTTIGNNYVDYPACDFTGEDDIFSCLYTSRSCDPNTRCNNDTLIKNKGKGGISIGCGTACGGGDDRRRGEKEQELSGRSSENSNLELNIIQNPITDILRFASNESIKNLEFQIFDSSGQAVLSQRTNVMIGENKINLTSLPSGIYFIRINTGNDIYTTKIMKL